MTPLERACRAVWKLGDNGGWDTDDPAQEDANWREHAEVVRAVLQAIREPSEAMVDAGAERGLQSAFIQHEEAVFGFDGPELVWQAMIDAALEEG